MQTDWSLSRRLIGQTLFVGLFLALTVCHGCAETSKVVDDLGQKFRYGGDMTSLKKGFVAYENGKLDDAIEVFNKLYKNTGSLVIKRQALYGLSICRLMKAETPEAFHEALRLWKKWRRMRATSPEYEDPAYLEPFLLCKFQTASQLEGKALVGRACSEAVSRYQYDDEKNRRQLLEKKLKLLEEKYHRLEAENDLLIENQNKKDSTIQKLEKKIHALEDIDQDIQKRKTETEKKSPE